MNCLSLGEYIYISLYQGCPTSNTDGATLFLRYIPTGHIRNAGYSFSYTSTGICSAMIGPIEHCIRITRIGPTIQKHFFAFNGKVSYQNQKN
jgi:hypothetical protein